MKYMVWIKLESFSKTDHTTFSLFFDNRIELGIVNNLLHLFIINKVKILPNVQMVLTNTEIISYNYSQLNNYTFDTKTLMDIFLSHFYITEDDLCYPCLLKINGRIFMAKDEVSFPSNSYVILKKQDYPLVFNFLESKERHILRHFFVKKEQETVLMLPELPKDLIYQLHMLYKDLLDTFSLLTFKEDYELESSVYILEGLTAMKEFFNLNDQSLDFNKLDNK